MNLCERCKKNFATVHLTEIRNGKREEKHLCEDCSQKLKIPHKPPITVNDIFGSLADKGHSKTEESGEDIMCPDCGTSYSQFRKEGRFGCPNDYKIFRKRLDRLLEKIHGSKKYLGKVPESQDGKPVFLRELLSLRQKLKKLIKAENYEEAAQIRDRINQLEKLVKNPSLGELPERGGKETP